MNEFLEKVNKTVVFYKNKLLIQLRLYRYQTCEVKLQRPIFIIGCSRAGTTLVYKTLSESRYLGSLQKETHDFWSVLHPIQERNWESHEIQEQLACDGDRKIVCRFFYSQTGKTRIVDKNNQNGLSIPYLLNLFPDAHFIYIKRSPGDNINSLIHGWNKADEFGTWSNDLPEKIEIEGGQNKRWCFFLTKGWRNYLQSSIEDVCAFQYVTFNEAILLAKQKVPENQWHEMTYEKILSNPVNEFNKVFNACIVPFDAYLKQHCEDVLEKPYNAFSEVRVDKWKDGTYKEKVESVLPLVRNVAIEMGYTDIT